MILADALANGFKTAPAVASVVASVASGKNGVATTQATAGAAVAGVATVATKKSNTELIGEISKKTMDLRLGISGHDRFDDRHYCHQCQHLMGGRCVVERFRPVDDIPRRCRNFEAN